MELIEKPNLRLTIEALEVGAFIDLPKNGFTASAARKAVQRIYELSGSLKSFRVSETAYPGGTRVTRLA